ncbi:hypothetical protein NW754_16789 [Fusarium falciforme]|uniref:Uncharacterized protein n=1 Tax=Fusarium falciforme TaxID=195108 RepID=A0A9W8QX00_9HYPO|nr:hypothetical protein NW754_16789 [Fusarium falciforme]KAJ4181341.1 hypothetical protein NW755_14970 [Fusarium falciforme]
MHDNQALYDQINNSKSYNRCQHAHRRRDSCRSRPRTSRLKILYTLVNTGVQILLAASITVSRLITSVILHVAPSCTPKSPARYAVLIAAVPPVQLSLAPGPVCPKQRCPAAVGIPINVGLASLVETSGYADPGLVRRHVGGDGDVDAIRVQGHAPDKPAYRSRTPSWWL